MEEVILDTIKTENGYMVVYGLYYPNGNYNDDVEWVQDYAERYLKYNGLKPYYAAVNMDFHKSIEVGGYQVSAYAMVICYYLEE